MAEVMRDTALSVLRSHQQTSDPVIVWRDGHVVALDQDEIARLIEELTRDQSASPPQAA